jgi:hypothetical protein
VGALVVPALGVGGLNADPVGDTAVLLLDLSKADLELERLVGSLKVMRTRNRERS